MSLNKYSFRGIQDLCRIHYREIMDRTDLKAVLDNRRVRFISPLGDFDYAFFGDFYFNGEVMMLITKEMKYARFHYSDQLSHTLWSTVPVIFAGVDTRFKDDLNQDIFTGDVVSYMDYTSFVRYLGNSTVPGLAGDNCDLLFEIISPMHKEGTVFSGISQTLFKEFDIFELYWPTSHFVPNGLSREEVIERASQAKSKPIFADGFKPNRRGRQLIYEKISEVFREGDILCYFAGKPYVDEGETYRILYADNIPEGYKGEEYIIQLVMTDYIDDSIKASFNDFLLHAHSNPQKTFILCDFRNELNIKKIWEHDIAMQFLDWYNYRIPNVVMPSWIFTRIIGWAAIGMD